VAAPDRRLEELLDAAGRDAQPRATGWETLVARATRRPQRQPRFFRRTAKLALAATLLVAVFLRLFWSRIFPPDVPEPLAPVHAGPAPVDVVRQGAEITIYQLGLPDAVTYAGTSEQAAEPSSAATAAQAVRASQTPRPSGLALVRDYRTVVLPSAGEHAVRFTDIAPTLDPSSLRVQSSTDPGVRVLEQTFEYPGADSAHVLAQAVGQRVQITDSSGRQLAGQCLGLQARSLLLSADTDQPHGSQTLVIPLEEIQALQLERPVSDPELRPVLTCRLLAQAPGEQRLELTYLCTGLSWRAQYEAILSDIDGTVASLDLTGWLALRNDTGVDFPRARIVVVAGQIHMVADPWRAPSGVAAFEATRREGQPPQTAPLPRRLFDYYLFEMRRSTDLTAAQKYAPLVQARGVRSTRHFRFDPARDPRRISVQYAFVNDFTDADMDKPVVLPRGTAAVYRRTEDLPVLLARDVLDAAPAGGEVTVSAGWAEGLVGEHREISVVTSSPGERVATYRAKLTNRLARQVTIRYTVRLEPLAAHELVQSSHPGIQAQSNVLVFDVPVPAGDAVLVEYTVRTRY